MHRNTWIWACLLAPRLFGAPQCPTADSPFVVDEIDGRVRASLVYDDGSGQQLYFAGDFTKAYGVDVNRIVRWDGARWEAVGEGFDGSVHTLEAFDDGSGPKLYAGGAFTSSGSTPVRGIARWNGSQWSPLGAGVMDAGNFEINAIQGYDFGQGPQLFVTGYFHDIGTQTNVQSMARWNGTQWFHLGASLGKNTPEIGRGYAMEVFDAGSGDELYVGGDFLYEGPVITSPNIGRWNATGWHPVASGVGNSVRSMTLFDNGSGEKLYFGTGALSANAYVYRWNGQSLTLVGANGLQSSTVYGVSALTVFDDGSGDALYAAGEFYGQVGGVSCPRIARWSGSTWLPLAEGILGYPALALSAFDDGGGPALFASGDFFGAGTLLSPRLARWRGGAWTQVGGSEELDEAPRALLQTDVIHGAPRVIAGGDFRWSGSHALYGIGAWDGATWSTLGAVTVSNNTSRSVRDLELFDDGTGPALYATGTAWTSNTFQGNFARWDGSQWNLVGGGLSGSTGWGMALQSFAGELFVGGRFDQAGSVNAYSLAAWNGSTWRGCGGFASGAFGGWVYDLEAFDDGSGPAIYAVGQFDHVGALAVEGIARLTGSTWSRVGTFGLTGGPAYALCIHDDGTGPALYASGDFTHADGIPVGRIARWNGIAWSDVGANANSSVFALAVHDDSTGPKLYAGGQFTTIGGGAAQRLARWDGSAWTEVLGGADGNVTALASLVDGTSPWPQLFIGGEFSNACGLASRCIARLSDPCIGTGVSYCTAGTTASGCQATMSSNGIASRSQSSGFALTVSQVEGQRDGVIYFGISGAQALPWGNGTSLRCVVPPVIRTGVQDGIGAPGTCDNVYAVDLNAWMAAHPSLAPEAGSTVFLQAWFRDPGNGSNKDTSFSDALRAVVTP